MYSLILSQTPTKLRTSSDRFCSPGKPPHPHRVSVTPDRDMTRRMSRLSNAFPPLPDNQRIKSPRPSLCSPLFQSQSQEVFSVGRRKSSLTQQGSQTNSPSTSRNKTIPANPTHSVEVENIPTDYYISPMDWSKRNTIAFALTDGLALINPKTMELTNPPNTPEAVVSVKFNPSGDQLFLGTDYGIASIYDMAMNEPINEIELFENSVLNADWKENMIISGDRDGEVAIIDLRDKDPVVEIIEAHPEEICAIKMHPEKPLFATCGNDCVVKIWDQRNTSNGELMSYSEHEAAIRAAVWSPMSPDVIVTGGGTADKTIKMWNINTGETIKSVDTGSQVCNLFWSSDYNEILSTHGFSQNHLSLWKGTDLTPVASFHTHKQRVLYMSASPDMTTVATAAPGDTMQIWKMFPLRSRSLSQSLLLLR
ncbi:Protein FIZZY-RELATED 2 [Tritrichomonas foetus]|uniref:Protein FIZZY-RELATED 2 n=1 Tax=Tritrichomonas foetus TaxID=1144522 RepID=A0A1J4K7Y6_9EUKA|nr:Protein FIZZY-RELATED 2 [Tritrichomonas foetus]|eukprot:OHT07511.1 Protein FIZZY-RELATED 2 [Tritrichomonas foetus]